jgi:hypothetical protein
MKKLIAIFCMTVSLYFIPEKTDINRVEGEWVTADSADMPMRFIFLGDYIHIFPDLASGVGPEFGNLLLESALKDSITCFNYRVENDTMYCYRAFPELGLKRVKSLRTKPKTGVSSPVCKIFVKTRDTLAMWERFNKATTLYARRR